MYMYMYGYIYKYVYVSVWQCKKRRNCAPDKDNVSRPTCHTDSKEPDWEYANSLQKCQGWANKNCNANTVAFWPGNWCNGFGQGCPYGEKDYPFGDTVGGVSFCKKQGIIYYLNCLYKALKFYFK